MGVCNCSMLCCTLLYVHSSIAIILMGKRELVALLSLSSWCLGIVVWLFLTVPWVYLHFVIVVFPGIQTILFSPAGLLKQNDWVPSQILEGPEFGGKLNSFQHHCQAFALLIIEVSDTQNLYSSNYHINSVLNQPNEDL